MARFYNRYWKRRGWYSRSSRAKQGSSTFTCRVPVEEVLQFKIPATVSVDSPHYWSQLISTCPYAVFKTGDNIMNYTHCSLLDSYLYRTYTRIYDQVKINAVSVSVGLMEGVGGVSQLAALRLYTNWDRDLTFQEITSGAAPTTPEELGTGSESQSYLIVNNSSQKFRRYCAARDLQEKTTYHDCSYKTYNKVVQSTTVLRENYWGDEVWAPYTVGGNTDATVSASYSYGKSGACGFVPSLMMAVWSPATFAADRVIPVAIKAVYSVTFRMPKFGLSSSAPSAKMSGMAMDAVEEIRREDDENVVDESKEPVLKKKKVVYEEEMIPDDEPEEEDEESQEPLTQVFKSPMKKAGKKSSS